jgi:perosamine synthetase
MIPIQRPSTGPEELEEIRKVLETGWLGMGSPVFEFENQLAAYLGTDHVVAVNTGTTALHIALDAFGVGPGDEVIVPSLTFCASAQAITATGAAPVFCDVEADTLNVDVRDVENRITARTKAVMPVHYCGTACDMKGLLRLREKHGFLLIEDAAHAFGSAYQGRKIGTFGDATCFSFDPIKNITCGEGGAVAVSDRMVADKMRLKRNLGISKDTWNRYKEGRPWFYEVTSQGYRYHMSNINAAIGLAQLRKLDRFVSRKRDIVARYNESFRELPNMSLLDWNLVETAPFMYILRIIDGRRDALIDHLASKGVGSGVHYIPNHIQPFFATHACELPVTEKIWKEIITLPLHCEMTDEDVEKVIGAVRDYFRQEGRA